MYVETTEKDKQSNAVSRKQNEAVAQAIEAKNAQRIKEIMAQAKQLKRGGSSLLQTGPASKVYSDKNQYSFMGWFNTLNVNADPESLGVAKFKDCYDYRSYALKVVRNLGAQALNGAFVYNFWSSVASGMASNVDSDPEVSAAAQLSCRMLAPVFQYSSYILEFLDFTASAPLPYQFADGSVYPGKDERQAKAYTKALLSSTGGSGLGALCGAMREKTALATTNTIGLGFSGAKLPEAAKAEGAEAKKDEESRFLTSKQAPDRRSKRQLEMSQEAAEAFSSVLLRSVDWHAVEKDSQKVGKALGALRQATDPVR